MKFLKKEKGFTLIELLVVVSIIGVLSTIVLSSLGEARKKSRYSSFKLELRQLQNDLLIFGTESTNISGSNEDECPSNFNSNPQTIFEREEVFNKVSLIADKSGIINMQDESEMSCFVDAAGVAAGIVFYANDFAEYEVSPQPGEEMFYCIDMNGNINKGWGSSADDFFDTFTYECAEDDYVA
ncbi:MAG: type II secretion system GspH family protein [Candidatus Pacebacteria bacterium]|nr:type II secretion system GspH family protein [Candidatus Paceibacterota bacterium]